jgi:adenylyltransferase/sulfurtransferase
MSVDGPHPSLNEGRFARLESIEWWDQALLGRARVLVVGAGALGNEVVKNLSLLGIGNLAIVDMDRVEASNLSRSVLFRESDEGQPKAACAAMAAAGIYPQINATALVGNIAADVGLGYFRWAQVVVGALDNREARLFVNAACARVGRSWLDGGIDVLQGIARVFAPPATACYECTMSQNDWDLLNKRRSCSLLARRANQHRGTPTTPTTASVIAGVQCQEVVKLLHGMEALTGRGFVFEGARHNSYTVAYSQDPECPWHTEPPPVHSVSELSSDKRLGDLWDWAAGNLGGLDGLDLAREMVDHLRCGTCGFSDRVLAPVDSIAPEDGICRACGAEMFPEFYHTIAAGSDLLHKTFREIGLPEWDIIWARKGLDVVGIELSGDCPYGVGQGQE